LARFDVIIIGAGASGLMCAGTAGRRGRRVLVLKKNSRAGKKSLISGGGRCNFINFNIDGFVKSFCKRGLSIFGKRDANG